MMAANAGTDLTRVYRLIGEINSVNAVNLNDKGYIMLDGRGKNIPKGIGYEVGLATSYKLKELGQNYFLVSGDGRLDTPQLMHEMQQSLSDNGIHVLSAGYSNTTPLFDVSKNKIGISGVNITASHQAGEYDGFKMEFKSTNRINKKKIQAIMNQGSKYNGDEVYNVRDILMESYIEQLSLFFKDLKPHGKVIYDAMQGVSFPVFERIAKDLNIEFDSFRTNPDCFFPLTENGPDPSHYGNLSFLREFTNGKTYDLAHIADGDGDRYALALPKDGQMSIVEPPHFVALRAKHMKQGRRNIFIAEHALAAIISSYLLDKGVTTTAVNRGRKHHIGKIHENETTVIGAAEIGLHNYDFMGIDDSVKNAFEIMQISQKLRENGDSLISEVERIKRALPFFIPELRIKSSVPKNALYSALKESYSSANDSDGVILDEKDMFWNLRASDNEDSKTLTMTGDEAKVMKMFDSLTTKLETIEQGLGDKFRQDLEKKLQDREEFCF